MTRKPVASPRTRIAAGAVVLVGAAAAYGLKAPPGPNTYKTLMLIGVLIGLSAVPRFDKLNLASLPASGRALIGVAMAVGIVAGVGALILLLGYGFKGAVIGMAASVGVAAVLYVISRRGVARN